MGSKKDYNVKDGSMDQIEAGLINRLPMGIMIMDLDGKIIFVNKHLSERLGMGPEKIAGSFLYDILEPSSIPELLSLLKTGKEHSRRLFLILNPPSGNAVKGVFSFEEYPADDRGGFMVILAEEGVGAAAEGIGLETLEALPIPVILVDRDLNPAYQNSAADEYISLLSIGNDPLKRPVKDRREGLLECLATGNPVNYWVSVKTREEPMEFEVFAVPLPSRERPERVMELWTPVEKRDKKGRLAAPHALGGGIIETSNAIIIGLDLEGNIILFNNGASRTIGYSFEEVKDTPWFDYLLDRDLDPGKLEVFQWSIGSGFRTQYETRVRSRSGKALIISLENSIIFDDEGNVSMVLMVGQDITARRRLEETLKEQRERLVEAIDEVTLYNDLMIHDIHNANAGIMGYLELMGLRGMDEKKREVYISRALNEVKKSSSIIKDVKVMSQARPVIEPFPMDLGEVFKRVCERSSELWGDTGPSLNLDLADLHVLADKLLEEALVRVIDNSFKHSTVKHPSIDVVARRDPSKSNLVPEPVHIVISDNCGVTSDDMKENAFSRPKRTDLGSHSLGFYLVKKIIDRFGGMVWLEDTKKGEPGLEVHILLREAV